MRPFKRVVVAIVAALACAGVYGALRNLPVASGCGFYGDCPQPLEVTVDETLDEVDRVSPAATSLAATPANASVEASQP